MRLISRSQVLVIVSEPYLLVDEKLGVLENGLTIWPHCLMLSQLAIDRSYELCDTTADGDRLARLKQWPLFVLCRVLTRAAVIK